jgi:hypothetical protein
LQVRNTLISFSSNSWNFPLSIDLYTTLTAISALFSLKI